MFLPHAGGRLDRWLDAVLALQSRGKVVVLVIPWLEKQFSNTLVVGKVALQGVDLDQFKQDWIGKKWSNAFYR